MTNGGTVQVEVSGRDVNLVALLARLETNMKRTDQVGIQLASTVGGTFTAAQQRAANAAITEAQALARAAVAAGDDARAHSILVNALGSSAAANDRNVASLTTSINRLQNGSSAAAEFGGAFKSGLLGIVGPAAAATAALGALTAVGQSFVDAFNLKAQLDSTTASINSQLGSVRNMSTVWAEAAATGSKYRITQAETNEILSNSVDVLRTSSASVGDLEIALLRLGSRDPSKPISEAARALRELNSGDTATIKELFNIGAADALKMKNEIQGGADAVQVLTAFLDRAGSGMNILEQRTTGALGKLNDLKLAQEELARAQAEFAQGPGMAILQAKIDVTRDATKGLGGDFISLNNIINDSGVGALNPFIGAITSYNTAVLEAGRSGLIWAGILNAQEPVVAAAAEGPVRIANAYDQYTAALLQSQQNALLASAAQLNYASSMELGGVQARAAALAAEQKGTADQVASIDAQTHAVAQAQLTAQAQAAAAALLANGQQGANSAAQLANSSSLVDILTAAFYRLAAAKAAAAVENVKALRAPGSAGGGPSDADEIRAGKRDQVVALRDERVRGAREAEAAEIRYQQTLGNVGPAIARAQADLAQIGKTRGTDSAAYIDQLNKIAQLEKQAASAAKGGRGGGGAGAAKISDQTKLNNTLLNDQEKYQDQAEQAERQHQENLLDIARDAAKRQLAQQKKNEIDKRESELGFLESITASELNATQEGRDAIAKINERYYADFDKAQKAAQAGNAAQSEAMVKAAGERAAAEQRYAEQIEQARQDGNKSEIERLEALREKQRQILDEKDKQIVEGGDANVNATTEALTAEQQRYEEQNDKIGTSAEQAAERKVKAAVRSGKAVSDETALLLEQEQILNRMGRTAAPGGVEGGPPAAPGVAAAVPQAAPGTTTDLGALLSGLQSKLDEVKTAIGGVEKATISGADKVARSVSERTLR